MDFFSSGADRSGREAGAGAACWAERTAGGGVVPESAGPHQAQADGGRLRAPPPLVRPPHRRERAPPPGPRRPPGARQGRRLRLLLRQADGRRGRRPRRRDGVTGSGITVTDDPRGSSSRPCAQHGVQGRISFPFSLVDNQLDTWTGLYY
jgi:hypothetical protein